MAQSLDRGSACGALCRARDPRLLLGVALVGLGPSACGGTTVPVPVLPPPAEIIGWAVGSRNRGNCPTMTEAFLLVMPQGQSPATAPPSARLSQCLPATSILPVEGYPWMFLIIGGELSALDLQRPGTAPMRMPGSRASIPLTRLLGVRAQASPLEILAAVHPSTADEDQVWSFRISDGLSGSPPAIMKAWPVEKDVAFADAEEFFRAYRAPRCQGGGRNCLTLAGANGDQFIEMEPKRDDPPVTWQSLGKTCASDVAWVPGRGEWVYLLVGCGGAMGNGQ